MNEAAFGGRDEAELFDRLRAEDSRLLSLVADAGGGIVGQILFSRMFIESDAELIPSAALAPMAVLPDHQQQGLGGALVGAGLDAMRAQGEKIVIVVGHPAYYPRFGFSLAKAAGMASPLLRKRLWRSSWRPALDGIRGGVKSAAPFGI